MTAATRALALQLRTAANVTPAMLCSAAAVIDTLLDVIELSRTVKRPPASVLTPGLGPLREFRSWHANQAVSAPTIEQRATHYTSMCELNKYFPKDDQL